MPHCTGRKLRTKEVKWLAQGHTAEAGQESEGPPALAKRQDGSFSKERSFWFCWEIEDKDQYVEKGERTPPKHQKVGQKDKKRRETEKHLDQGERGWASPVGC